MIAIIDAFRSGFGHYVMMVGVAGLLLLVACTIYVLLTPWKELSLVRGGNSAAGLALAGAIAGLAMPIAACLASSSGLLDLLLWGTVALLMQLLTYRFLDIVLKDLPQRIRDDEAGAAIVLISAKLAVAMLLSAGLWDPALQRLV